MKDVNRQKVYRAERNIIHPGDAPSISIEEAREIIAILSAEFEVPMPRVRVNRKLKAWGGWYRPWCQTIEFPRDTTTLKTVLHEFAHHLDPDHEGHGPSFCRAMIKVVDAWIGTETAYKFRVAYEAQGIDISEPIEARKQRLRNQREERERRNEERVGEKGTGWVVEYDSTRGHYVSESTNPSSLFYVSANDLRWAKVWRRESAAEKWRKQYQRGNGSRLVEVPVKFVREYGERGGFTYRWAVDWRALDRVAASE